MIRKTTVRHEIERLRIAIVAAWLVGFVSQCWALDGDGVPLNHPIRSAIVSVVLSPKASCTGAALPNGVILTAAHCVLKTPEDYGLDHSNWSREVQDFHIVYYGTRGEESRRPETVSTFVDDSRDIALVKVAGGHPDNIVTFEAPVGPNEVTRFYLGAKPMVLLAGRGGHGAGTAAINSSDLRYATGEASGSTFSPAGFFISLQEGKGGCGGDSGSPVFLVKSPGLPSDIRQFLLVGVLDNIWRGGSYGDARRKCSQQLTVTSTVSRPSGVDSNAWLSSVLKQWDTKSDGAGRIGR